MSECTDKVKRWEDEIGAVDGNRKSGRNQHLLIIGGHTGRGFLDLRRTFIATNYMVSPACMQDRQYRVNELN